MTLVVSSAVYKKYVTDKPIKVQIKHILSTICILGEVLETTDFENVGDISKFANGKYIGFIIHQLSQIVTESLDLVVLLNDQEVNSWLINTSLKGNQKNQTVFDFAKKYKEVLESKSIPKIIGNELRLKGTTNENGKTFDVNDIYNGLVSNAFMFYSLFYAPKWHKHNNDKPITSIPLRKMRYGDSQTLTLLANTEKKDFEKSNPIVCEIL
jgi:hypothetical protein